MSNGFRVRKKKDKEGHVKMFSAFSSRFEGDDSNLVAATTGAIDLLLIDIHLGLRAYPVNRSIKNKEFLLIHLNHPLLPRKRIQKRQKILTRIHLEDCRECTWSIMDISS